jgi:hypothetical protein
VGEHAFWAVLLVLLALYILWKLPASYGWYAVATLVVVLTASNLASLERYGLGCFPFVVAGGLLTENRKTFKIVLGLSGLLLILFSVLSFLGLYVP